jgi:hypothetical protein
MLNRKLELKFISLLVSKKLYSGSIFDCELIDNSLYIFDCPLFAGKSLKSENLHERLSYCDSFLSGIRIRPDEKYKFHVKQFVVRTDYSKLNMCNESDGYVFVPVHKPVQTGTHNFYFKWKPLLQNTVDFAISPSKQVYLQNAGKLCKSKITMDFSQIPFDSLSFENNENIILECQYITDDLWMPLHIRQDKTMPNSVYTYKRTIVNIQEDIQLSELVS